VGEGAVVTQQTSTPQQAATSRKRKSFSNVLSEIEALIGYHEDRTSDFAAWPLPRRIRDIELSLGIDVPADHTTPEAELHFSPKNLVARIDNAANILSQDIYEKGPYLGSSL
jgi:hypothetical protein